jgi:hypothetical protein
MPYGIRKTHKGCYSVYNKKTKRIFSKCSSKKNAYKQSKLLRALMFNSNFKVNPKPQTLLKRKQTKNTRRYRNNNNKNNTRKKR